jgi:hypothetical protein
MHKASHEGKPIEGRNRNGKVGCQKKIGMADASLDKIKK